AATRPPDQKGDPSSTKGNLCPLIGKVIWLPCFKRPPLRPELWMAGFFGVSENCAKTLQNSFQKIFSQQNRRLPSRGLPRYSLGRFCEYQLPPRWFPSDLFLGWTPRTAIFRIPSL